MVIGKGLEKGHLTNVEIFQFTQQALSEVSLDNKKVLVIIPDLTRIAPIPRFFRLIYEIVHSRVKQLDYMIALGTHPPLSEKQFLARTGITLTEWKDSFKEIRYFNHAYDREDDLIRIGTVTEEEVVQMTGGLMQESVAVTINKHVMDYDFIILLSPVVPHETAGFSGGSKYLFPGISGADVISFFHWLGAIITNAKINGVKYNPVRSFLNRAASFLDKSIISFSMVVHDNQLSGLFIGDVNESWSQAADLSSKLHVQYQEKPYHQVLGITPAYYDEIWVAGKVMYKLESIVADGGELIIYAPHIKEFSVTFKPFIEKIGYHVRDYFIKQMERFQDIPRGVLAHSANIRGTGTYEKGIEKPRILVTLSTAISKSMCEKMNLGYRDPDSIDVVTWKKKEGILVVENAGGVLYRLKD
jgi:nickel-dependent lactate racemase